MGLKSAYKQLPAAPAEAEFNAIEVRVAPNRVEYYRARMLLRLCGWKPAGNKHLGFSGEFVSLGAQVNLMHLQTAGKIIGADKPGRLGDLKAIREKRISEGFKAGMPETLSLRGKINYAKRQTHSRVSGPPARLLSIWSRESGARPVTRALKLWLMERPPH